MRTMPNTMGITYKWRVLLVEWIFDWAAPFHIMGAAVILPFAQADLGVPKTAIVWIMVGYSISTATCILPATYLGNILGRKRMILIGSTLDMASLIGIFLSPSLLWLVPIRMLGGAGNAMAFGNLPPITVTAFPIEKRGQAIGFMNLGVGVGMLLTPIIAGVLADTLGWRYLFLFASSMYAIFTLAVLIVVKETPVYDKGSVSLRRFDYLGVFLIAGALLSLTFSMQNLNGDAETYKAVGLLTIAMLLVTIFVIAELRSPYPLVDPRLLKRGPLSLAATRNFIFFLTRQSLNFLVPFYLILGLGWSGTLAGTVMVSMSLTQPFLAPTAGYLVGKLGTSKLIPTAFGLVVTGCLSLILIGSDPPITRIVLSLLIVGAGNSLFMTPNMHDLYGSVAPEKLNLAQGLYALAGHTSSVIGASLGAVLLGVFMTDSIPAAFQQTMVVVVLGFITFFVGSWILLKPKTAIYKT
jgi:MFS family permease